jgi:hypothetical protein
MIEKLATDYDHNYIKENQFQENLFLLLRFLNLYCTCLKAYVHESFYYPLVMLGDRLSVGIMGDRLFVGMMGDRLFVGMMSDRLSVGMMSDRLFYGYSRDTSNLGHDVM